MAVRNPCFHRFIVPIPHLASAKSYLCAKDAREPVFWGELSVFYLSLDPLSFRFPFDFHKLVTFRIASPAESEYILPNTYAPSVQSLICV